MRMQGETEAHLREGTSQRPPDVTPGFSDKKLMLLSPVVPCSYNCLIHPCFLVKSADFNWPKDYIIMIMQNLNRCHQPASLNKVLTSGSIHDHPLLKVSLGLVLSTDGVISIADSMRDLLNLEIKMEEVEEFKGDYFTMV